MDWVKFAEALSNEASQRFDQASEALDKGMTSSANSKATAGVVLVSIARAVRASIKNSNEGAV